MKTAREIIISHLEDYTVTDHGLIEVMETWMIEYGNEVLDMCVTISMAIDITNSDNHMIDKRPDTVWRELFKLKSEIK